MRDEYQKPICFLFIPHPSSLIPHPSSLPRKELPMPETLPVQPYDVHNQFLVSNVHPPDWANPEPAGRYNLVVLGAGTAGLVSAAGAAGLGARVALVEGG